MRDLLETRIRAIVSAQAESFGVKAEIDYQRGYPVTVNTQGECRIRVRGCARSRRQRAGELERTGNNRQRRFRLHARSGAGLLSVHRQRRWCHASACMVHNPAYNFNDDNIAVGSAFWVALTQRFCRRDPIAFC